MVRQTAAAARDGTVLLAPCPRDVRLRQPVRETVDVQIARSARNAVRRSIRPPSQTPTTRRSSKSPRCTPRAASRRRRICLSGKRTAEDYPGLQRTGGT